TVGAVGSVPVGVEGVVGSVAGPSVVPSVGSVVAPSVSAASLVCGAHVRDRERRTKAIRGRVSMRRPGVGLVRARVEAACRGAIWRRVARGRRGWGAGAAARGKGGAGGRRGMPAVGGGA